MTPIWKDPIGWTASIVASPQRFWFMATALFVFYALALLQAHLGGFRSALGPILFLSIFQFQFLYALRKLYQEIGRLRAPGAA